MEKKLKIYLILILCAFSSKNNFATETKTVSEQENKEVTDVINLIKQIKQIRDKEPQEIFHFILLLKNRRDELESKYQKLSEAEKKIVQQKADITNNFIFLLNDFIKRQERIAKASSQVLELKIVINKLQKSAEERSITIINDLLNRFNQLKIENPELEKIYPIIMQRTESDLKNLYKAKTEEEEIKKKKELTQFRVTVTKLNNSLLAIRDPKAFITKYNKFKQDNPEFIKKHDSYIRNIDQKIAEINKKISEDDKREPEDKMHELHLKIINLNKLPTSTLREQANKDMILAILARYNNLVFIPVLSEKFPNVLDEMWRILPSLAEKAGITISKKK